MVGVCFRLGLSPQPPLLGRGGARLRDCEFLFIGQAHSFFIGREAFDSIMIKTFPKLGFYFPSPGERGS
jgi:hypothetical protein